VYLWYIGVPPLSQPIGVYEYPPPSDAQPAVHYVEIAQGWDNPGARLVAEGLDGATKLRDRLSSWASGLIGP
jgi:hypothetical protein